VADVRTMFVIYLGLIFGLIGFYMAVGLLHE
jgi:hypothetical protein